MHLPFQTIVRTIYAVEVDL